MFDSTGRAAQRRYATLLSTTPATAARATKSPSTRSSMTSARPLAGRPGIHAPNLRGSMNSGAGCRPARPLRLPCRPTCWSPRCRPSPTTGDMVPLRRAASPDLERHGTTTVPDDLSLRGATSPSTRGPSPTCPWSQREQDTWRERARFSSRTTPSTRETGLLDRTRRLPLLPDGSVRHDRAARRIVVSNTRAHRGRARHDEAERVAIASSSASAANLPTLPDVGHPVGYLLRPSGGSGTVSG